MSVFADDVARSLKGTAGLLGRRADALDAFDVSEAGFWRSFGAIGLTLPAAVVLIALEHRAAGSPGPSVPNLDGPTLGIAAGILAGYLAIPLVMILVLRRLRLTGRFVPFVVVTNWTLAVAITVLCLPALLLLLGLATPALAWAYAIAFGTILLHIHWFGTKATLEVPSGLAAAIALANAGLVALVVGTAHTLAA